VIAGAEISQQRDDWQARPRRFRRARFPEQHLAEVVLQQELFGDVQRLEQTLNITR
jgi:hypothetical protein